MKYWEIIADNLSKAGWSYGYVSAVDSNGRTIWIVDAHLDGMRFVVRADEKLMAFLGLESAMCACGEFFCAGEIFSSRRRAVLAILQGGLTKASTACGGLVHAIN